MSTTLPILEASKDLFANGPGSSFVLWLIVALVVGSFALNYTLLSSRFSALEESIKNIEKNMAARTKELHRRIDNMISDIPDKYVSIKTCDQLRQMTCQPGGPTA